MDRMTADLRIEGAVLLPGAEGYDEARSVWNAMIDRRPAIVARCVDANDVAATIRLAVDRGLPVAIQGGGHNVAGHGTCDGGVLVDLSEMRSVSVDLARRVAKVGGGARWRDVDAVTQRHGLATPSGIISSTGVGGLTLGGGIGWLARQHGLTSDNLRSAQIVCADGVVRTVDADEEPELFWGLRGGGGNFGVVTELTFALHDVGPEVLFGPIVFAHDDAEVVLRAFRDFARTAPRECCVWPDLLTAPPLPFLPERAHGTRVLSLLSFCGGDPKEGERALAPLMDAAEPLGHGLMRRPYVEAQSLFDETYAAGKRNYWTTDNFTELTDDVIAALVEASRELPTDASDILIHQLGGAIDDPATDATAYPHRGVAFAVTPGARWEDPADDGRCVAWAKGVHRDLAPHALGTAYSNFVGEARGAERAAYGGHLDRLRRLKRRYDPDNVFSSNQNVAPG